jgi:predicted deacylase
MLIHNTSIDTGQKTTLRLPIGSLPSGESVTMDLKISRAKEEGPSLLITAGIHGDEINGVEILRRLILNGLLDQLKRGSLILIPIVNVYGFINRSREVPDGKDVNRSFPGNMSGSLASRIARTLTKKILPEVDMVVDLHTGGHGHYNYPQIRYTRGDKASELLGKVFNAPFLIEKTAIRKSFRRIASDNDTPFIIYEGGEDLRLDELSIQEGMDGILRMLAYHDMIDDPGLEKNGLHHFQQTSWLRAAKSGIFRLFRHSGQEVRKGEMIGEIGTAKGNRTYNVQANRDGMIIGHNNKAVVNQGDALFHIAY